MRLASPAVALALALSAAAPAGALEPTATLQPSRVELFPRAAATIDLNVRGQKHFSAFFHASTLSDEQGALGAITLPATYLLCNPDGVCERHPLFPGLRLEGYATSTSGVERSELPDGSLQEISAQRTERLRAVVVRSAGVDPVIDQNGARSRPRRLRTASGRPLDGLAWTGWGERTARAGRVMARRMVDCGGTLYYSRVRVKGGEAVRVSVPCGTARQVYAG